MTLVKYTLTVTVPEGREDKWYEDKLSLVESRVTGAIESVNWYLTEREEPIHIALEQ